MTAAAAIRSVLMAAGVNSRRPGFASTARANSRLACSSVRAASGTGKYAVITDLGRVPVPAGRQVTRTVAASAVRRLYSNAGWSDAGEQGGGKAGGDHRVGHPVADPVDEPAGHRDVQPGSVLDAEQVLRGGDGEQHPVGEEARLRAAEPGHGVATGGAVVHEFGEDRLQLLLRDADEPDVGWLRSDLQAASKPYR